MPVASPTRSEPWFWKTHFWEDALFNSAMGSMVRAGFVVWDGAWSCRNGVNHWDFEESGAGTQDKQSRLSLSPSMQQGTGWGTDTQRAIWTKNTQNQLLKTSIPEIKLNDAWTCVPSAWAAVIQELWAGFFRGRRDDCRVCNASTSVTPPWCSTADLVWWARADSY